MIDETPDGGFGRTENAQDVVVEMARQSRDGLAVNQTGHGEQRSQEAQKRVAVAGYRPVPVDRASLRVRHSGKGKGGGGAVDKITPGIWRLAAGAMELRGF